MPILAILWANKRVIGEVLACAVIAAIIWWFGFHNPAKIKTLEQEKVQLTGQIQAAHAAINMLQNIERGHDVITKISYRNISTIRYATKPSRTGIFYNDALVRMPK